MVGGGCPSSRHPCGINTQRRSDRSAGTAELTRDELPTDSSILFLLLSLLLALSLSLSLRKSVHVFTQAQALHDSRLTTSLFRSQPQPRAANTRSCLRLRLRHCYPDPSLPRYSPNLDQPQRPSSCLHHCETVTFAALHCRLRRPHPCLSSRSRRTVS